MPEEARPDEVTWGQTTARRHRRTPWVRGAIGVAGACAVAATALGGQADRPPVRTPGGLATPVVGAGSRAVVDGATDGVVDIDTGPYRFSAHAIAVRRGRFVVVGDSSDLGPAGPAVYWSDDGHAWHAATAAPTSVNVTDVVATRRGFVAVGVASGDGPGAWTSEDGATWQEAPVPRDRQGAHDALWGVTRTRLGLSAWGFAGGAAHLWRSDDGQSWSSIADRGVFDRPGTETICTVEDTAGGLQARGVEAAPGAGRGHAIRWRSRDGRAWTESSGRGASTLWCDPTELLGHWVARAPGVVVSVAPYGDGDYVVVDRADG